MRSREAGTVLLDMLVSLPVRNLDEAEPVAPRNEAHRLGVDGDGAGCEYVSGQVFFVEMDGH